MSLINEMLRDLEARRAAELGKQDLQREIRPLPGRRQPQRRGVGLGAAGLLLVTMAGAGVWAWQADLGAIRTVFLDRAARAAGGSNTGSVAVAPIAAPMDVSSAAVAEAIRLAEGEAKEAVSPVPAARTETPVPPVAKAEEAPPRTKGAPSVPGLIRTLSTAQVDSQQPKAAVVANAAQPAQGNIEKTPVLGTPRERADAEYKRAQGLLAVGGATTSAVEALQGALKQDPGYGPARQLLLKLFLESRRIDEAMALLQEGVEHHPAQVGWAMSLARLQVEKGDLAAGEQTLARSRAYGAASPEFLGFHGYLLHRLGQHKVAAEQYLQAARINTSDGRWWLGLGQALEADGRSEDARGAYRRAVAAGNLNADLMALAEQKGR